MEFTEPWSHFQKWYEEASQNDDVKQPGAVSLATASSSGSPSIRVVQFCGVEQGGFMFGSVYNSKKGKDLQENPQAAMLFHWQPLARTVRVEGSVVKTTADKSDQLFSVFPRTIQFMCLLGTQSEAVASLESLKMKMKAIEEEYGAEKKITRPEQWGGYRLKPSYVEFYQGHANDLHERIVYRPSKESADTWTKEFLIP